MRFVEFQRFMSDGVTRPCLCRTDTGELWVIKVHGNPLGSKAIFNELVVGKLAEMIVRRARGLRYCNFSLESSIKKLAHYKCGMQIADCAMRNSKY